MKWWDFSNNSFVALFCILTIFIVFLMFLIISLIVTKNEDDKFEKQLKKETNTIRTYLINPKDNSIIFFDRRSIRKKRETTLTDFYSKFYPSDADKVKRWIFDTCVDNKETDDYIEADVMLDKGKTQYFSILKKIKFCKESGVLHIESHVLRYISPRNKVSLKKKSKSLNRGAIKRKEMQKIIVNQKSLSGYTFCFRFFYKDTGLIDGKVEKVLSYTLKNVIYGFAKNSKHPRQIIDENDNELILFDLKFNTKEDALELIANIEKELEKTIGILGDSNILFAIGAVENSKYYQDFSAMVKASQHACIYAQQNEMKSYLYTKTSSKIQIIESGKYNQEIDRLLKPTSLTYLFRPILEVSTGNTIGYFEYVKAYSSPFTSYTEMNKYASKINRNKELFAHISNDVISIFSSERSQKSGQLFLSVSLLDIDFIYDVLKQNLFAKDTPIVLLFSERDFDDEDVNLNKYSAEQIVLKDAGFKMGLLVHDENLLLEPSFYSSFDYFVVGGTMTKEIKRNKKTRLSIHSLVEQLLKYKKPIIATDIESWQAIELVINSGIKYISSETISSSHPMVMPVEKRKVDRIVSFADKYQ